METARTVLQFEKADLLWEGTAMQVVTISLPQFPPLDLGGPQPTDVVYVAVKDNPHCSLVVLLSCQHFGSPVFHLYTEAQLL